MLDSHDLSLVHALAQSKTMRGAAQVVGVHQSTLFRRLDHLEQSLGVRLFERLREGYVLTPAGERVFDLAQRLQDDLVGLERGLQGQDMRPYGTVRVTTTDTLSATVLTPLFAAFRKENPEIELEVIVSNQVLTLTKREADVAIRPTVMPPQNLVGRALCALGMAIYTSPNYLKRLGAKQDLSDYAWIGPDESLAHLRWAQWLKKTYPRLNIPYRINTLVGMRDAAKAGLGLTILPCYLGDSDAALQRVDMALPEFNIKLWLLTHPDLRHVARVRAFMNFVANGIAERAPLIEGKQPNAPMRAPREKPKRRSP